MNFGSLFSGIGGIDLGLERAGMTCMWQVEIDDYANQVLAKHWPDVARYRDVRECGRHNLAPVDLICGGFPCQPVSHAGKRRGTTDNRFLWPEMLRIISELQPSYVVGENVFGLVTHEQGVLLANIITGLEAINYEVVPPIVFPASSVGAPHRRDRVWIMAHSNQCGKTKRRERSDTTTQDYEGGDNGTGSNGDVRQESIRCTGSNTCDVADAEGGDGYDVRGKRAQSNASRHEYRAWPWATEPAVGRVADGVPRRVDRLKCLGNAVVPAVAQFIGERILACHSASTQEQG